MKKHLLVLISILVCALVINTAQAKTISNSSLASAIRYYKSGNYSQAYISLSEIVEKDPSNAVAYYYLGMTSAQIGKREEALDNYAKVISLSPNSKLSDYASKGKICIESPEACHEEPENTTIDKFIRGPFGTGFSKQARSDYEKQKIENMMREMNRDDDISPRKFKDYRDFSSEVPTNDEIVNALRVIQRAGLSDIFVGNNTNLELSAFLGKNEQNNNNYDIMNMLLGRGSSGTNLDPQVIQALLNNQLSTGF